MKSPDIISALQRAESLAMAAVVLAQFGNSRPAHDIAVLDLLAGIEQACRDARGEILRAVETRHQEAAQ